MKSLQKHIINCLIAGAVAVLPVFGLVVLSHMLSQRSLQPASAGFVFIFLGLVLF